MNGRFKDFQQMWKSDHEILQSTMNWNINWRNMEILGWYLPRKFAFQYFVYCSVHVKRIMFRQTKMTFRSKNKIVKKIKSLLSIALSLMHLINYIIYHKAIKPYIIKIKILFPKNFSKCRSCFKNSFHKTMFQLTNNN